MKNFMENNVITHNLMSFSGFKSLYIFSMLLEGPKTYKEIKYALESHEYLHETVSIDTIRIYINSLKNIGCNIKKTNKGHKAYYSIDSHPFELAINKQQAESILKIFKAITNSIDLSDFMELYSFFEKFEPYIQDEDLKEDIKNISPLSGLDLKLINDLQKYAQNKNEITIFYNSANSGHKNIDIIADKIHINNGKIYLSGYNSEHENYGSFLVSKIIKVVSVNIGNRSLNVPEYVVKYEILKNDNEKFVPIENEEILEEDDKKILVEFRSKNKFDLIQRILIHANKCRVVSPEDIKTEVISVLKKMKEGYIEGN